MMVHPIPKPAVTIASVGFVIVAAYSVLGALQILVLNPMAAAPDLTLAEIEAAMAKAGESFPPFPVMIFVSLGLLLAAHVMLYAIAAPDPRPEIVAVMMLVILALGAPAYFAASFPAGMALADTFMISGGDHSHWSALLFLTSATALVCAIALAIVLALQARPAAPAARDD
jgi:hypothetical protein